MALTVSRKGYAQVEPNHLSGIVTGQILAQLPVNTATMGKVIENGRFAKYDYKNNKVDITGDGEWMMIYNEEKLYDERKQSHKDFAMVAENYTDGEMVPRLISTVLGDIFTTNAFGLYDPAIDGCKGIELKVGDKVYIDKNTGYLCGNDNGAKPEGAQPETNNGAPVFQVVKEYTMADGQPGVKLMRIQ